MPRRSNPPAIAGFEFIRPLGQGGFADVFLYQQRTPRRRVALKVLIAGLMDGSAFDRLAAEADAMAELSAHPNIVTVYGSGQSDDGRPYLAMEYCPKPALGTNFRATQRSVADVLTIGVQIAGAVETAHRAGVLHRDIKPANILVTQYDNPALTDFGIAMSIQDARHAVEGMSVPWSPPEAFAATPWAGPATDVWGLAATVYSLLARRAPFELPGGDNSTAGQMDRLQHNQLPPLGREDAPVALDQVLSTAMAKDPASRYPSALALGRAFQGLQRDMQLDPTRLVVQDESEAIVPLDDSEPATRLRSPLRIDPTLGGLTSGGLTKPNITDPFKTGPTGPTGPTSNVPPPLPASWNRTGPPAPEPWPHPRFVAPAGDSTVLRGAPTAPPVNAPVEPQPKVPKRKLHLILAGGLVLIAVATGLVVYLTGGGEPADQTALPASVGPAAPQEVVGSAVPSPEDLTGTIQGDQARFTWTNPDPQDGDTYRWAPLNTVGQPGDAQSTDTAQATVPLDSQGRVCVEVTLVRANGQGSAEASRACAPAED